MKPLDLPSSDVTLPFSTELFDGVEICAFDTRTVLPVVCDEGSDALEGAVGHCRKSQDNYCQPGTSAGFEQHLTTRPAPVFKTVTYRKIKGEEVSVPALAKGKLPIPRDARVSFVPENNIIPNPKKRKRISTTKLTPRELEEHRNEAIRRNREKTQVARNNKAAELRRLESLCVELLSETSRQKAIITALKNQCVLYFSRNNPAATSSKLELGGLESNSFALPENDPERVQHNAPSFIKRNLDELKSEARTKAEKETGLAGAKQLNRKERKSVTTKTFTKSKKYYIEMLNNQIKELESLQCLQQQDIDRLNRKTKNLGLDEQNAIYPNAQ